MVPRLHVVTDEAVLRRPEFIERAREVVASAGDRLAFHLRAHGLAGRALFDFAIALMPATRAAGAMLFVNDRIDVALAARADGVQLGARSIACTDARRLMPHAAIGYSAHSFAEVEETAPATDFVLLGTIYETATHADRAALGPRFLQGVCRAARVPVIAIGGITPARVAGALAAGAHGVAVLGGVWNDNDPAAGARGYLNALRAAEVRA